MKAYHVGIAIVNYKTSDLVVQCLAGVAALNTTAQISVCIVDNASGDGSYERLVEEARKPNYSGWVTVVDGKKNGGFSYGNNLAAANFQTIDITHFWMLNPDAVPKANALEELLNEMGGNASCFIAGSQLQDEDGTPQVAAFNFPSPFGEFVNTLKLNVLSRIFKNRVIAFGLPDKKMDVDWVAGASMLIRWHVFKEAGFMDEGYFLYFEEVDLCKVIQRLGGKTVYVPASVVVHYVGAATGISDTRRKAPRRPAYWFSSRRRFFQKNYGFFMSVVADILWLVAYVLYRGKAYVQKQTPNTPPHFLRDFICHSSLMKGRI